MNRAAYVIRITITVINIAVCKETKIVMLP